MNRLPDATNDSSFERLPADFQPWWQAEVRRRLRAVPQEKAIDLEQLLVDTLDHSAQVRAYSDIPVVRETGIREAHGAFDPKAFVESKFLHGSDPVGNTLTTGGASRFLDRNFSTVAGLRGRNEAGGQIELSQRLGVQDTNSTFFVPHNQGSTRLTLRYTQPLVNGAGRCYNTALITLARIDADAANDEMSRQLQSHLYEVTRAYWGLYLERAAYLQKKRLLDDGLRVLDEMQRRDQLQSMASQIIRAKAAVASRQSDLIRARMAIENAEAKIRSLVNSPHMLQEEQLELIPAEPPFSAPVPIHTRDVVLTAIENRPEILQAAKQIDAASLRLDMSEHELKPVLNFVMESYVAGLEGNYRTRQAFVEQFTVGEPGYNVGFLYEMPFGNNVARAKLNRRRAEIRQLSNQLRATIETLQLESKVAVREVQTSYQEMVSKYREVMAAADELRFRQERWRLLPGEDQTASIFLENLLESQARLTRSEFGFVNAQVVYSLSLVNLERAQGTLLQAERIVTGRSVCDSLPELQFIKEGRGTYREPPDSPAGRMTDLRASLAQQPLVQETAPSSAPPLPAPPPNLPAIATTPAPATLVRATPAPAPAPLTPVRLPAVRIAVKPASAGNAAKYKALVIEVATPVEEADLVSASDAPRAPTGTRTVTRVAREPLRSVRIEGATAVREGGDALPSPAAKVHWR